MDQLQKIILYILAMIGSFFAGTTFSTLLEEPSLLNFKTDSQPTRFASPHYDLNKITEEELCLLPGIGSLTAKKILSYRQKHLRFKTIDELKKVPTIGTKKFNKLKIYFYTKMLY